MAQDGPGPGPDPASGTDDVLDALRAELEAVDEVAVQDRVELFERANTVIARSLAELDEV